jgi:hypothetical protein
MAAAWTQLLNDDGDPETGDYSFGMINPDGDTIRFLGEDGVIRIDNNDYRSTHTITGYDLNSGFFDTYVDPIEIYAAGQNGIYTAEYLDQGPTSWGFVSEAVTPILPSEVQGRNSTETLQDFLAWAVEAINNKSDMYKFGPIMLNPDNSLAGLKIMLKELYDWYISEPIEWGEEIVLNCSTDQGENGGSYGLLPGNGNTMSFYYQDPTGPVIEIIVNNVVDPEWADNIYPCLPLILDNIQRDGENYVPTNPFPAYDIYDIEGLILRLLGIWALSNVPGATLIDKTNALQSQINIICPVGGIVWNTASSWAPAGWTMTNIGSQTVGSTTIYAYRRDA